jgi:aminomethyltransferase
VKTAALFRLPERGVIEVTGADRVRWLDGMISADVKSAQGGDGAWGLLLTRQGRVVADLHVLARPDSFWLELERAGVARVIARLSGYVIADDVTLADRSDDFVRLALEGPRAAELLAAASGEPVALARHAWREVALAGARPVVAAYGFTGQPAYQLFVPVAVAEEVEAALLAAGAEAASGDTLECLRIEAGTPRLGHELDESVLPAEAGLEDAVATQKGCYTGQEVVARMRTRGRAAHRLMGLRFEGERLPERGAPIEAEGGRVGQVTSAVRSPELGAIGLGFVRADLALPGASVRVDGARARIAALPLRDSSKRSAQRAEGERSHGDERSAQRAEGERSDRT